MVTLTKVNGSPAVSPLPHTYFGGKGTLTWVGVPLSKSKQPAALLPEKNNAPSVAETDGAKQSGVTFLQKLADLLTVNQNMETANSVMAMGRLFGSEQLESTGKQLGQTAYENYRDSAEEFQYIAERGASGAAKGVQGVVNALGYLGQTQNQAQMQQNAQTLAAWGTLTGDQNFKGAAQHMNDFAQRLNDAGLQDTVSFGDQYQQDIQERYADTDITKTGQFLGDVSETLGGLAPAAAMNAVAPGSGLAITALSAGGNATQEALASGASDHQAMAYGIAVGGAESVTEKFFDGVAGLFGKGAADDVVKSVAERLAKDETAQAAMVKVANGLGEGFEEFVSEFAQRVSNELLIDTDDRSFVETLGDAGKSALMGLLVSGIVQTADTIGQGGLRTPAQAAEQAAESVVEQIRGQTAGTEYRAEKPQNVELPTVPIINLSMQDVADLNGGQLPRKGNYLRKTAIDRAQRRLGLDKSEAVYIEASNVRRNGEDYVLKLTKSSVSKMLNPSDGSDVPNEAIAILENIERIANNGVYFKNEGDRKGRPQIAGFDHLMTTVYIDNTPTVVDMRVKLVESGKGTEANNVLYYFTPEAITITKDGAAPAAERHAFRGGALPSSNFKLTQGRAAVNSKIWNADRAANAAKPGVKKQSMQNGAAVSARSAVPFEGNGLSQRMAEAETEYNAAIAQAEYTGEYQLAAALYEEKLRVQEALTEAEIHRLRNELEQYQRQHQTGQTAKKPKQTGPQQRGNDLTATKTVEQFEKSGKIALPDTKLSGYALNPKVDPNKAEAFRSALGYTMENADQLKRNILDHINEDKFVEKGDTGYGMRYEQVIELIGPNGKTANVLTAWIQDGDQKRMTSLYITKKAVTK